MDVVSARYLANMRKVALFGLGGHGKDIASDLDDGRTIITGWDDSDPDTAAQLDHLDLSVFAHCIVGINDPATRRRVAERLGWVFGQWVHRRAVVGPDVMYGAHTHINAGAFLTRCTLGDFVTVGPNATICGDVTIGDGCLIGAGAVVKNLVTIGDGVTVGAGAVVVADVPDGQTVVGNPAKPIPRFNLTGPIDPEWIIKHGGSLT